MAPTPRPSEIAASVREALASHDGYLRDAALLLGDWGFSLTGIRAPTQLWYGVHDDRNPPSTGQWWAERITSAQLHLTPTTHLATLLANWHAILRWSGETARSADEPVPTHP
nr:hypothetical protein [uncultured Nocardioides sp.]